MWYLRTASTRRLLALLAAGVAVVVIGTAIAVAASSGGPVPPPKPLANAVHDAIAAPSPQGVSGRFDFSNHLLDAIDLRGSNPLLAGGSGRFWATNDGRVRVELQSSGGGTDAQFVSDGKSWWAYDGNSKTVYRGTVAQHSGDGSGGGDQAHGDQVPAVSEIQKHIDELMKYAGVSRANPLDIFGEPAYQVSVAPKKDGGLIGSVELAWDAGHGTPLHAALFARGDSTSPVLDVTVKQIDFGAVDASAFDVQPPPGVHAQDVGAGGSAGRDSTSHQTPVTGLSQVQAALPFKLAAPDSLAGRNRGDVRLLGKDKGALLTYGDGLSGVAVIESQPQQGAKQDSGNGNGPLGDTQLPTVTIGGAKAQELSTPLGTAIRFERAGVAYTVIGSVDRATAEAAARGL